MSTTATATAAPYARPDEVGLKICEALGLDPSLVQSLLLNINAGDPVFITVNRLLLVEDLDKIKTVLEQYKLVPLDAAP